MAAVSRSDIARLALRLGVGGILTAHGAQKLFGWFGGHGIVGTAKAMESMGFRPGRPSALAAGVSETAGGVMLVLGLATPSTGAATASTMAVAAAAHGPKGLFASNGGYEYPAVLGLCSAALAIAGPGKISLDHLLDYRLSNRPAAILSLVATAATTAMVLRRRQSALAATAEAEAAAEAAADAAEASATKAETAAAAADRSAVEAASSATDAQASGANPTDGAGPDSPGTSNGKASSRLPPAATAS
jgi:putative oxidoreductase